MSVDRTFYSFYLLLNKRYWYDNETEGSWTISVLVWNTADLPLVVECLHVLDGGWLHDLAVNESLSICLHSIIEDKFAAKGADREIEISVGGNLNKSHTVPDWATGLRAITGHRGIKRRHSDEDDEGDEGE